MKVTTFTIRADVPDVPEGAIERRPFIRVAPQGGCDLPDCNCSGDLPWLSVSNGQTGITMTMSLAEMNEFIKALKTGHPFEEIAEYED